MSGQTIVLMILIFLVICIGVFMLWEFSPKRLEAKEKKAQMANSNEEASS